MRNDTHLQTVKLQGQPIRIRKKEKLFAGVDICADVFTGNSQIFYTCMFRMYICCSKG